MNEVEKAFADVKIEGADGFKEIEQAIENNKESTPTESQPVKVEESQEPVQGESTESKEDQAFHRRWADREAKLRAELDEKLELQRQEFESKIAPREENTDIPEWFVELYGENETAWGKYKQHEEQRREEIKNEIISDPELQRIKAEQEELRLNRWIDDEVVKLQSEGKQFDRNELIKVLLDYRPTDENNNFDFQKGYQILEALKAKDGVDPEKSQARKRIGDISTRTSNSVEKRKDYVSSTEIRKKSWSDL